jgi:septum formation protein
MNFYLASQSPRRAFLLKEYGYSFKKIKTICDEESFDFKNPQVLVKKLSFEKAQSSLSVIKKDAVVLSADTTVYEPQKKIILNKPINFKDAFRMLKTLSGKSHFVYTGYTIVFLKNNLIKKKITRAIKTEVFFKKISDKEITYYIKNFRPMDKAGAYGIQDFGGFFVRKIIGSYTNIIGLPLAEVCEDLAYFGVHSKFANK